MFPLYMTFKYASHECNLHAIQIHLIFRPKYFLTENAFNGLNHYRMPMATVQITKRMKKNNNN